MIEVPELRYMPYKDGRIAFRESGDGPAIFLLHGMNGDSRSWAYLFHSLNASFRLIAWDAPSFGKSDVFGDEVSDFKNAAKALLQGLEIKSAVVIGHSMGGLVALQMAADETDLVSGLILSSSHLGFGKPKGEALMPRYADRIDLISSGIVDIDYGIERARRSTPPNTPDNTIQFLANISTGARLEGIRDGGRMSQEADNVSICSQVDVPVLILSGGQDKVISKDMHAALISALPFAKQAMIPKAGHASSAEYPEQVTKHIKEFAMKTWRLKSNSPAINN